MNDEATPLAAPARRDALAAALLLAGGLVAYVGYFLGEATSATGQYGRLLRSWAMLSALAAVLFLATLAVGRRWARVVAIILLTTDAVAGIDPAYRLMLLGFNAP
jgi:hypothetical protein